MISKQYPFRLFTQRLTRMAISTLVLLIISIAASANTPLPVHDKWGGNFTLTDHYGIPIQLNDFNGKVVLLNFGYTHCPDVCPATMFNMKQLMTQLGDDGAQVQVLFITLDPERDTPQRLQSYVEYFNSGFVGLTGTTDEIKRVADQYGMRYEKEAMVSSLEYSIAHTGLIYLLDQQGRIRVFFKLNASAERIAQDVRALLAQPSGPGH